MATPRPTRSEIAVFEVVVRAAERMRGLHHVSWYLRARLDQILDDCNIPNGPLREDIAARAFFILDQFARAKPLISEAASRSPDSARRG